MVLNSKKGGTVMKKKTMKVVAILMASAIAFPAFAGPEWKHQNGTLSSNGSVTVKSLSGGTYTGTQNPTGAIAKTDQNAVTQAPTIVVQATAKPPTATLDAPCNSANDTIAVTPGNTLILSCQGNRWKDSHLRVDGTNTMLARISSKTDDWAIVTTNSAGAQNAAPQTAPGSLHVNDIYIRSIGKWASQLGSTTGYAEGSVVGNGGCSDAGGGMGFCVYTSAYGPDRVCGANRRWILVSMVGCY